MHMIYRCPYLKAKRWEELGKMLFFFRFIQPDEFTMSFGCPVKELTLVILKAVTKRIRDDGMGGGDRGKTP